MSKIKLICTDIDGTLNWPSKYNKHRISKQNIESIKEFVSDGKKKLILATGRDLSRTLLISNFLEKSLKNNQFIPFLISLNGGLIFDNLNKKIVFETTYQPIVLEKTYKFVTEKHKIKNIFIVDSESVLHIHPNCFSRFISHSWFFRYKKTILKNNNLPQKVKKIIILLRKPIASSLKTSIEQNISEVYVACSGNYLVEIIDKNINKFFALEKVAHMLGVKIHEICTIGNEGNDIKMLENTGFSSAVDFDKTPHLVYKSEKIKFYCENNDGTAFSQTVQKLKELQHL